MREEYIQSGQKVADACLMSIPFSERNFRNQSFVIAESLLTNKKTTLQDKSIICAKTSQKQKLSRTLVQDSIIEERVLKPYWNDYCEETSSQLWSPTKTVLQDLDMNLSNIWSSKTLEKSWFSTNLIAVQKKSLPKIFLQFSQFFHVECMDSDDTIPKSKKIRIYPTKNQQKIFHDWFGTSRFVYNCTVEYLKQKGTKADWRALKTDALAVLDWCRHVPYQIKSIAIQDACKAVKAAKKKYQITKEFQEVHYKSKKNPRQCCYIPKAAVNDIGIYYTLSGSLKYTENLPEVYGDTRLILENGKWFLCLPIESQQQTIESQNRVVALDPGVRTFMTFYTSESCGKLGVGDFGRIMRLCFHMDGLISRKEKETSNKQKQYLKKAIQTIRWKIKNLVLELHHKVAKFLVSNFDIIIIPSFETQEMVLKEKRKIRSKTARNMMTYSYYKFSQFLKHKAFEFGKRVVVVTEEYTSKTVSWTGEIVENLGGRKFIKSKKTGAVMDRDYNGARGIFLKALVDSPMIEDLISIMHSVKW